MNRADRRLLSAVAGGLLALAIAGFFPGAALAGGTVATWANPPSDELDVPVGQRLLPLALSRGGHEVPLATPDGAYLRAIFDRLAASARLQRPLPYALHVLSATDRADAWSLSDGSVYVTLALLRKLPTVDEVAAALAHQLAHAALRHNLDDVTSAEGKALLQRLATGVASPERAGLGRFAPALLGEFYPASEERAADALAARWLREAGYRFDAQDILVRRLAGPFSPYLEAHPHPGIRPLPGPPAGPPVIGLEDPSAGTAAPPPPLPPPPAPPVLRPYLPPAPPLAAPRAPGAGPALSLVGGFYPLRNVREVTGSVQFKDWQGESGSWLYPEVVSMDSAMAFGGLAEVPFSAEWEGLLGLGGFAGGPSMAGQPRGSGGFVLGGLLQHGVSGGVRWAVGPYAGLAWGAAPAGRVPDPGNGLPWLEYGSDIVHWGTPVTARTFLATLGGMVTMSGETPVRGLTWFAAFAGQASAGGDWHYYADGYFTGEELELPFTGVNASPLSASGMLALGGLALRF